MAELPPSYRRRLLQLAKEARIPLAPRSQNLPIVPEPPASFEVEGDFAIADRRLWQIRENDPKRIQKLKGKGFDYKEIGAALNAEVEGDGDAGVAECLVKRLLALNGNVNLARKATTNLVKRNILRKDTVDQRNHLLRTAAEKGNLEMVQLLVRYGADQESIDEAFKTCLGSKNVCLIQLLLRHGASASASWAEFKTLIGQGQSAIISLILKDSSHAVPKTWATQHLKKAVSAKVLDTTLALLGYGADGDYKEAKALKAAIENDQRDMTMAIIASKQPPSPTSLDNCIGVVNEKADREIDKLWFMEVLLCGGAAGPVTSQTLVESTSQGRVLTMRLLVRYNASIEFEEASALKQAVRLSNVERVTILLQAKTLASSLATAAFALIDSTAPPETQLRLAKLLLDRGAFGDPLHDALIQAVKVDFVAAVALLIDPNRVNTASISYKDAMALRDAVSRSRVHTISQLMKGPIEPQYLEKALLLITSKSTKKQRFEIVKMLLKKGCRGKAVDQTLQKAVHAQDEEIIELLVQHGAKVVDSGTNSNTLQVAAQQGIAGTVKHLLQSKPSKTVISSAVTSAMTLKNSVKRYEIIQLLVSAGGCGVPIANALIDAITLYKDDERLLKLLLKDGQADVNHRKGEAVAKAVSGNVSKLALVVGHQKPTADTITRGLQCAMKLEAEHLDSSKAIEILLAQQRPAQGMAEALIEGVKKIQGVSPKPLGIINALLSAGADVNYRDGSVLEIAVKAMDLETMELLLTKRPEVNTINHIFPSAVSIKDLKVQEQLYKRLIAAGAKGDELSKALAVAVRAGPDSLPILELLLPKASVNFEGGKALCFAAENFHEEQFTLLLKYQPSAASLNAAFSTTISSRNSADKKYEAFQLLLKSGVKGDIIAKALIAASAEKDERLVKLFLTHEASVDFQKGAVLVAAVKASDCNILSLLVANTPKPAPETLNAAFLQAMSIKDLALQHDLYSILLKDFKKPKRWGFKSINRALLAAVKKGPAAKAICTLLLDCGACVDIEDGAALVAAVKASDSSLLALLAKNTPKPSVQSFISAFKEVISTDNVALQHEFYSILLENLGKQSSNSGTHPINIALLAAAKEGTSRKETCSLLLSFGASVDFSDGEPVKIAIESGSIELLELLLTEGKPSQLTLEKAFQSSYKSTGKERLGSTALILKAGFTKKDELNAKLLSETKSPRPDPQYLLLLLKNNASVHFSNNACLLHAAKTKDHETLEILLEFSKQVSAQSEVFEACLKEDNLWKSPDGAYVMKILLDKGANGAALNTMLIEAISDYDTQPTAPRLVEQLLRCKADVDFNRGEAVQIAARNPENGLLAILLQYKPNSVSLSWAFPTILSSGSKVDTVIELVELLAGQNHALDVNFDHPSFEPILKLCLVNYPQSTDLISTMLEVGYYVDKTVRQAFGNGEEDVSLLCWALNRPLSEISDAVIQVLLDKGANVNFKTPVTNITPLSIAIRSKRHATINTLLSMDVDVNMASSLGRSPLWRASQQGDVVSMRLLISAGAETDDGSLHEAAKDLHLEAVKLLLDSKHLPNYPSGIHGGRTVLQVLCSESSVRKPADAPDIEKLMKKIIKILMDAGANCKLRRNGKSLLLNALDCARPETITKALLDCTFELINDKINLYASDGYNYSALSYVEKGKAESPKSSHAGLMTLLSNYGAEKVFYADEAPQPGDFIGAPEWVVEDQRKWKANVEETRRLEEYHVRQLRLAGEKAEAERLLAQQLHEEKLELAAQKAKADHAHMEATMKKQLAIKALQEAQAEEINAKRRATELEHTRDVGEILHLNKARDAQLQLQTTKERIEQEALGRQDQDEFISKWHNNKLLEMETDDKNHEQKHKRALQIEGARKEGFETERLLLGDKANLAQNMASIQSSMKQIDPPTSTKQIEEAPRFTEADDDDDDSE